MAGRRRTGRALLVSALMLGMVGCAHPMSYPRTSPGPAMGSVPPPPVAGSPSRAGPPRSAPTTASRGGGSSKASVVPSPTALLDAAAAALDQEEIAALVSYASSLVGEARIVADGTTFTRDCSGFVRACYYSQGLDLFDVGTPGRSGSESIYNYIKLHGELFVRGTPLPGDVVFFHNTYDRNRNGRRDDLFTHVALVESVDRYETVTLIHFMSGGIIRSHMNLKHRELHTAPSSSMVLNDYLRRADGRHEPATTGDLFFAYGRLF